MRKGEEVERNVDKMYDNTALFGPSSFVSDSTAIVYQHSGPLLNPTPNLRMRIRGVCEVVDKVGGMWG